MQFIIKILGFIIISIGCYILFDPGSIFEFIESNLQNPSLYIGAIVGRLVLGLLFLKAASKSTYPTVIKVVGILAIMAAVAFIIIGRDGFQSFIISLLPLFEPYGRIAGLACVAFGGFLIYAFSQKNIKLNSHSN